MDPTVKEECYLEEEQPSLAEVWTYQVHSFCILHKSMAPEPAEKLWLKVLLTDLLWEKNIIE